MQQRLWSQYWSSGCGIIAYLGPVLRTAAEIWLCGRSPDTPETSCGMDQVRNSALGSQIVEELICQGGK